MKQFKILLFIFFLLSVSPVLAEGNSPEIVSGIRLSEAVADPKTFWETIMSRVPKPSGHLVNMPMPEIEKLHRLMDVAQFNSRSRGLRWDSQYSHVAERLMVHQNLLKEADEYMEYTVEKPLADAFRFLVKEDANLKPDFYNPIRCTAIIGSHTVIAEMVVPGCPGNLADIERIALQGAERLKNFIFPTSNGFKVTKIKYDCAVSGTSGYIDLGFWWKRSDPLIHRMTRAEGSYGVELPELETHWWQDAWNNKKKLKE